MVESNINNTSRVVFPQGELNAFLLQIEKMTAKNSEELSKIVGISSRTYRDWKREKYSISYYALHKLCGSANIALPKNVNIKRQYWYTEFGAKKGGTASFQKHKSVGGDPKVRLRLWRKWWDSTGKFNKHTILERRPVNLPPYSGDLAEFVGILLGDGGMSSHQITITLHWKDDRDFLLATQSLCEKLFGIEAKIVRRRGSNVGIIVLSRVALVDFFKNMGLVVGNKVRQQVDVPKWIKDSDEYAKRCIRGLIDTDGSFYLDRHRYASKTYVTAGIAFTNRSIPLLSFVKEGLTKFGFHPTQKTSWIVFLRREEEVHRYFKEIGSSNQKHFKKYQKYAILRQRRGTEAVITAPTRNRLVP